MAVDDLLSRDANQPPEPPKQAAPNAPQGKYGDAASTQGNGEKPKDKDADEKKDEEKKEEEKPEDTGPQKANFHAQTTVIFQGDSGFSARYSGPNSLSDAGERQETMTADLFTGIRLWRGAEMHVDALAWQGFGLSQTFGIEAFPNADAYRSA